MSRRHEIWSADCETDPFKVGRIPKPFIWGAYEIHTKEYQTFSSVELFQEYFNDRKATVYFHNGGKFDAHYLRRYFNSDEQILIINGRIAKFKIGRCEFRDSYNLIPVALSKYQKEKIDYAILEACERDKPENAAQIESYLKSDCANLAALLLAYFGKFGKGLTQAGAAMSYWVKNYNDGHKPHQSAAQFERYKPYYYGGRVECLASGYSDTEFTVVDKNSAYPHAMLSRHPISPEAVSLSSLPNDNKISQCFVSLRAVSRGAFPYRLETGELIFPRDKNIRIYHVTGWELLAAQEMNAVDIEEILTVHYFREVVDFSGYINHFYMERRVAQKSSDKAMDIFAKLFMNSCYGKFASNPENYHEYLLASVGRVSEHVADGWSNYHAWGDGRELLWRSLPVEKHRYYNVATAASITGYVRAELFKDLCSVRHPFYCDTDSISAACVDNLQMGSELGEWKIEFEADAYAIVGKKMYAFRDRETQEWSKIASKGVNLTADELIRAAKGEEIQYQPQVPCYTITRPEPRFIPRTVRLTAKVQYADS